MCAPDPADRFASVDELRVQLLGVLREVVAEKQPGTALTSAASVLFEAPAVVSDALAWDELPALRVGHHRRPVRLAVQHHRRRPQGTAGRAQARAAVTPEVQLARARAALQAGWDKTVHEVVNQMLTLDPWEWRAVWMSGLLALQRQDVKARAVGLQRRLRSGAGRAGAQAGAGPGLRARRRARPGGAALPDLRADRRELRRPGRLRAGPGASAARTCAGAVQALDLVPSTSRNYPESQRQRAELLYAAADGLPMLAQAMDSIERVRMDPVETGRAEREGSWNGRWPRCRARDRTDG